MEETKQTETMQAPAKKKSNILLIVAVVLVVLLAACGLIIPRIIGGVFKGVLQSNGISIDEKKGDFSIKTDEGELKFDGDKNSGTIKTDEGEVQYGEGLSLPSDFPKNVPILSDANILSVTSKTANGSAMVVYTTSKTNKEVYDYYKAEMVTKGWTEQMSFSEEMLSFTQGDQSALIIVAKSEENKGTSVTVTVGEKQ